MLIEIRIVFKFTVGVWRTENAQKFRRKFREKFSEGEKVSIRDEYERRERAEEEGERGKRRENPEF